jgi:hypothetical protein
MSSARPIVFPYKITAGRLSPMISIGILLSGRWQVAELYVDSGAFYTVMHARFATDFGLDYTKGRKIFVQVGDGSLIPVYLHELVIQIGDKQFRTLVGFSSGLGVSFNLLGRFGVFEHFRICFHEKQKTVSFLPVK